MQQTDIQFRQKWMSCNNYKELFEQIVIRKRILWSGYHCNQVSISHYWLVGSSHEVYFPLSFWLETFFVVYLLISSCKYLLFVHMQVVVLNQLTRERMKHVLKITVLLVSISAFWIGLLETSVVPRTYTWLVCFRYYFWIIWYKVAFYLLLPFFK